MGISQYLPVTLLAGAGCSVACVSCLQCNCPVDGILPRCEQIAFGAHTVLRKQPAHGVFVRFEVSVCQYVADGNALAVERVADEQRPVAVQGFLFRTHDRGAATVHCVGQATESVPKSTGTGGPLVADTAVLEAGRVVGTPAEFRAEIGVADAPRLERSREGLAVELRIEAAVRRRAYVGQSVDPMLCEQLKEEIKRMVGVPDGEYDPRVHLAVRVITRMLPRLARIFHQGPR